MIKVPPQIIIKNKKLPDSGGPPGGASTAQEDEADSDFEDEQFLNEISSGEEPSTGGFSKLFINGGQTILIEPMNDFFMTQIGIIYSIPG